jgi:hypothetical protein
MSQMGHFQPEILRAATHFAAGWLQKLTQFNQLVCRNFRPRSADFVAKVFASFGEE